MTTHEPQAGNIEEPAPIPTESPFHETYATESKRGYEAIGAAIDRMQADGYAVETELFLALASGFHAHQIEEEARYALAGFFAGAANRLRETLSLLSQIPEGTVTH